MYEKETSSNYWEVQKIAKLGGGRELELASDWGRVGQLCLKLSWGLRDKGGRNWNHSFLTTVQSTEPKMLLGGSCCFIVKRQKIESRDF